MILSFNLYQSNRLTLMISLTCRIGLNMFALAINLVNKKKGLKKTMKKLEETWIKKQKVLYK